MKEKIKQMEEMRWEDERKKMRQELKKADHERKRDKKEDQKIEGEMKGWDKQKRPKEEYEKTKRK